jgi:hypothetical protein
MATRVHRSLIVEAINLYGTARQRYELGKQLQALHRYGSALGDTSGASCTRVLELHVKL